MRISVEEGAVTSKSAGRIEPELTTTDWSMPTIVSVSGSSVSVNVSPGSKATDFCPSTLLIVRSAVELVFGARTLGWMESASPEIRPERRSMGIRGTDCETAEVATVQMVSAIEGSRSQKASLREVFTRNGPSSLAARTDLRLPGLADAFMLVSGRSKGNRCAHLPGASELSARRATQSVTHSLKGT